MYDSDRLEAIRISDMQSAILNQTGSSRNFHVAKPNLISKFSALEIALKAIEEDARKLTAETKESLRFTKQIKHDLGDREIEQQKAVLTDELKKLDKSVKYGISESQKRSQKIWMECRERLNASEALKNTMNDLRIRLNRLQNTLGFDPITENIQ